MVELVELWYEPEQGKFKLQRDDKSYMLTLHELVAMLRDFERQIERGEKKIRLKAGPDRVDLPEAPIPVYVAVLAGFKDVWTSWRRSRYGLQAN